VIPPLVSSKVKRLDVCKGNKTISFLDSKDAVVFSGATLFHFPLMMTGGKDARTLENPGKCQGSNSLFFMVTFGSKKA
jgi:hypothetical protein